MSTKEQKRLPPIHPGEVLRDLLHEANLTVNALALALRVPANRIGGIVKGQRGITADTALRLGRYFGTSAQMWINLQRRRRNLLDLGLHGGVLPAAFRQEFLEDHGGALDLVGVVLRFHAEPDFAFLEAVEDFGDGHALGAGVLDGADDAALGDHEADDEAEAAGFGIQADI